MDAATVQALRQEARRLVASVADADDLVQDTLVAALEAGRDERAWLAGVMRNQAAMTARSAVRRRRREAGAANDTDAIATTSEPCTPAALLATLPPAARRVAVFALHGLAAEEIRWILDLTPAAFRQRLTSIRKALGKLPPAQQAEALALAYVRDPARVVDLQFGLVRSALRAALAARPGLATHDLDGHLIVIHGRAHTRAPHGNG